MKLQARQAALLGGVVVVLAAAVVAWLVYPRQAADTRLEASGQIRGDEVTLSSKLSGVAEIVAFREGQDVRKGDLLVQIAARDLEARLEQARAQRDVARSLVAEIDAQLKVSDVSAEQARIGAEAAQGTARHEIHRTDESLARARAQVDAAESQLTRDKAAEARFRKLLAEGFVSQAYFDDAASRFKTSEANLVAARRGLDEAGALQQKARSASGEAAVRAQDVPKVAAERVRLAASRESALAQERAAGARIAELEAHLSDARISAPVDATVIAKTVQPGELVAAGRPLATLVDLGELNVRVFVPEAEIGRVRIGDLAWVKIDAFPQKEFAGKVVEISQRAEFTPKEVHVKDERVKLMFGVKVRIDEPAGLAKPGMPADVWIAAAPRDG